MLKSSANIFGENNARRLLKSVQNHEVLINNIPIIMPDNFIFTLNRMKIIFQKDAENFNTKF